MTPLDAKLYHAQKTVKIMFWNVGRNKRNNIVISLAADTSADAIVLVENGGDGEETLRCLQQSVDASFFRPPVVGKERFQCFCRTSQMGLAEFHRASRMSFRRMMLNGTVVCLVLAHGVDPRNNDCDHRYAFASQLAKEMLWVKQEYSIAMVVIGDLNMNPFDPGIWMPTALNAVPTKRCASKRTRSFNGVEYDLYYNPMWSMLGDESRGPPGTIYDGSSQGFRGWSVFDQVLVHHSLVPVFRRVDVLTSAKGTSLTTPEGRPSRAVGSDHFPILVTMES